METPNTPRLPFLATAGFILLFSGCVLYQNVSTEQPLNVNFSDYHSYGWLITIDNCDKIPDVLPVNEIVEGSVEEELNGRGFAFDSEWPDLLLRVSVCHKRMEEYPGYLYPWSFPFLSRGLPGDQDLRASQVLFPPSAIETPMDFLKSTITLSVYDHKNSRLIWRASTEQDLYYVSDAVSVTRKTVKTLMEKFPVKPLPEKMAGL
jgi:hypothetical protein